MSDEKKLTPKQRLVTETLKGYQDLSDMTAKLLKYANRFHAARTFLGARYGLPRELRLEYAEIKLSEISTITVENAPLCIARSKVTKANYETLDNEIIPALKDQLDRAHIAVGDFEDRARSCLEPLTQIPRENFTLPQMDEVIDRIIELINGLFAKYPDLAVKPT